ncbi:MAG: hypothetical protein WC383_15155 [Gammaproteobacteria bacterium]
MWHKENCGICGLDFEWQDDPELPAVACPYCGQTYEMAMADDGDEEGGIGSWFYLEPRSGGGR